MSRKFRDVNSIVCLNANECYGINKAIVSISCQANNIDCNATSTPKIQKIITELHFKNTTELVVPHQTICLHYNNTQNISYEDKTNNMNVDVIVI